MDPAPVTEVDVGQAGYIEPSLPVDQRVQPSTRQPEADAATWSGEVHEGPDGTVRETATMRSGPATNASLPDVAQAPPPPAPSTSASQPGASAPTSDGGGMSL